MSFTLILLIILAVVILYLVFAYNGLVTKKIRVQNAWADIDVQLKRRFDLIPNLINTVKGAANFETSTLESVVAARNSAMQANQAGDRNQIAETENILSGTLKSLFALSENYPDLKATANFSSLQNELTDTEDKIQAARRFYNNTVTDLNTAIQTFPSNLIAGIFNFKEEIMFKLGESEQTARNPVEVKF